MRRQRLPLDQKVAETLAHAGADRASSEMEGGSGKPTGMPLFLNQLGTTPDGAAEAGDLSIGAPEVALDEAPLEGAVEGAAPIDDHEVAQLPEVSGEGPELEVSAYSVTLQGRTDANFSSSFRTRNVRTTAATGCDNCADSDCVHVTGTLVSTFSVATTVTLPTVNDFPNLTACQRQRVRDGINNVLRPHEQQHVTAFRTYNGTVSTPFDLTLCRGEFDAEVQALHDSIEAPRQAAAQAASDALDPFQFDVDLDC